ncbi:MAG: hypothetical protein JW904_11690 [Spirochaetales bacterium]|nr:hypothetical protein [Spirochaetales bacterium]
MNSLYKRKLFPLIVSGTTAILVPFLSFFILGVSPVMLFVYAVIFLKLALLIVSISLDNPFWKAVTSGASSMILFVFGIFILAGIVITPLSHFQIWFTLFMEGENGGIISNHLFLIISFFTCFFSSLLIKKNTISPITGLIAVLWGLSTLITRDVYVGIGFGISLMVFIVTYIRSGIAFSMIIIIVCTFFAGLLWMSSPEPAGSEFVSKVLHTGLRNTIHTTFPSYPLLIGIPEYGYTLNDNSIGQEPMLSPIPLYAIEGTVDDFYYIRTETFDYFTGTRWGVLDETPQFYYKKNSQQIDIPGDTKELFTIRLLLDSYLFIPHTASTRYVLLDGKPVLMPREPGVRGIRSSPPLMSGNTITLFVDQKPDLTPLEDRSRYLQLPANLSDDVRALAQELKQNETNPQVILSRIRGFLATGYTYTLETNAPPAGSFVINDFLFESKEGFCEHFATAFILLARLCDIPARYSRGNLVVPPEEGQAVEEYTIITGLTAHAWAEVWLEGFGWTTWESTPPFAADLAGFTPMIGEDSYTESQLEALKRLTRKQQGWPFVPFDFTGVTQLAQSSLFHIFFIVFIGGILCALLLRWIFSVLCVRKCVVRTLKKYIAASPLPCNPETIGWGKWGKILVLHQPDMVWKILVLVRKIQVFAYSGTILKKSDIHFMRRMLPRIRKILRKATVQDS